MRELDFVRVGLLYGIAGLYDGNGYLECVGKCDDYHFRLSSKCIVFAHFGDVVVGNKAVVSGFL